MGQLPPKLQPLLIESPLPIDFAITDDYDNYIFTVIETSYEVAISPSSSASMTLNELSEARLKELKKTAMLGTKILRSYSSEAVAREWTETGNNNIFLEQSNLDGQSTIFKIFGTNCVACSIDPETYECILRIKKFDYVKNELHGALLSC